VKQALEKVVLFSTNTHDGGAGEKLGESYQVHGLPHFVLTDSSGAALDRWVGFRDASSWLKTFQQATLDFSTIESKEAKFKEAPTEMLASSLGRIHASLGETKESVDMYKEAARLGGGPKPEYAMAIFSNMVHGMPTGAFTIDEVRSSADAVMSMNDVDPVDRLRVARSMADIATDKKDPSLLAPYLEPALKASEGLTEERAKSLRSDVEIAGALLVKRDEKLALSLKRKSMPAGWENRPSDLNEFAWWCFESHVNLEEAETLARKGISLAQPGEERAQILDTAAEICNLLGNCDDAVSLAEQAAKEDPKDEHYAKQLKRFAEIRDKKKAEAGA